MDITQLQYFAVAAKEQHFTKAANKLNVSQPTLSASISRLENELGCSLFSRSGRQVILNDSGQILLKHTETILQSYQDALSELEELHRKDLNSLTIACMTMHVHNSFLRRFQKKYPDIRLTQKLLLAHELEAALKDSKIDFIIANILSKSENTQSLHLSTDPLYLAVSRDHPLSKKRSYTIPDIANELFIVNPGGTGFVQIFETIFTDNRLPVPRVAYALPSEWKEYISQGYIGFVTEAYFRSGGFDSSVVFLPPDDPACCRDLYLLWNKHRTLSKSAKLFLQAIETDHFL